MADRNEIDSVYRPVGVGYSEHFAGCRFLYVAVHHYAHRTFLNIDINTSPTTAFNFARE